jgi:uncharacterized protein (DUF4415 family)
VGAFDGLVNFGKRFSACTEQVGEPIPRHRQRFGCVRQRLVGVAVNVDLANPIRRRLEPLPRKQQVTLRIDADVLEWFKARGPGYQTRINELLRAYKKAHEGE